MDQNLTDRFGNAVKNIQSSASDLLQVSSEVVARSGLSENEAHNIVEQTFKRQQQQYGSGGSNITGSASRTESGSGSWSGNR